MNAGKLQSRIKKIEQRLTGGNDNPLSFFLGKVLRIIDGDTAGPTCMDGRNDDRIGKALDALYGKYPEQGREYSDFMDHFE